MVVWRGFGTFTFFTIIANYSIVRCIIAYATLYAGFDFSRNTWFNGISPLGKGTCNTHKENKDGHKLVDKEAVQIHGPNVESTRWKRGKLLLCFCR